MPETIQLTDSGATVPYGICVDSQDFIWTASKGGVFRFNRNGQCLFADKHEHPKQILAFSTIHFLPDKENANEGKILSKFADESACFLALYDMQGCRIATTILDSMVKDVAITKNGLIFLTSRPESHRSDLLRGHVDDLATFETIASSTDFQFEHICCTEDKLIVSCVHLPINPYSSQRVSVMNFDGKLLSNFSRAGKENGEIFWPRALEINKFGNLVVLDKTGRLQEFSGEDNHFLRIINTIPAGLANGFCTDQRRDQFLVTCSGLVFSDNEQGRAECNDWIEYVSAL